MFLDEKALPEIPVRTLEPWREELLRAARSIREVGLAKGEYMDCHGRRCTSGAILDVRLLRSTSMGLGAVTFSTEEPNRIAAEQFEAHLRRKFPQFDWRDVIIPKWNDLPDQTAESVAAELEECARERT